MAADRRSNLSFDYVDGLRALAALGVAFLHAALFTGHSGDVERDLPIVLRILSLGNYGVAIFIVLSGFVLSLPIVRSPSLQLPRGLFDYLKRRARRILPPYFISLGLFGALIFLVPVLREENNTAWDSKIPVTLDGVLSHLLLVHNLSPNWLYQINGPAWSVATEWQLYFALPLLILPVWRRFGRVAMLTLSIFVGIAFAVFLPELDGAHFWFLGLFAMGGLAAEGVARDIRLPKFGLVLAISWLIAISVIAFTTAPIWISETVTGASIALSVVWLARRKADGLPSVVNRLLELPVLVWLGSWSYSIYLVHSPILGLGNLLLLQFDLSTLARFALQVCLVLPLALVLAFAFHFLVERRFMTSHQARIQKPRT